MTDQFTMESARNGESTPKFAVGRLGTAAIVVVAILGVALSEVVGTRVGRDPVDGIRVLTVLSLVLAGAFVYRMALQERFDKSATALRASLEDELALSKDTFIANVSHGLRTPLTGVVGFAHLLNSSPIADEQREAVDTIIAESAELSRMVDDLVTAAHMDSDLLTTNIEPIGVLGEVEKMCEFMDLLGAEVGFDVQDMDVMADREHFAQVLRNLVANAHRHGKTAVTVRGAAKSGVYFLHIVDQGPGVPKDLHSQMFTRFASSAFGGEFAGSVGLGLSVVAELTARMGGEVSYRRIRGETQFVLSVPVAYEQTREIRRVVREVGSHQVIATQLDAVPA
jgi:signal transduction histidine kinase